MIFDEVNATIRILGQEFDSHKFIQKYIKHFPASYSEILRKHDCVATAHAEIAIYLRSHADELRIERIGKNTSRNILDNETENTLWKNHGSLVELNI